MSNKYDANEHIKVLAEINTLLDIANETQAKINTLRKELKKIDELKKDEDEIPFYNNKIFARTSSAENTFGCCIYQ